MIGEKNSTLHSTIERDCNVEWTTSSEISFWRIVLTRKQHVRTKPLNNYTKPLSLGVLTFWWSSNGMVNKQDPRYWIILLFESEIPRLRETLTFLKDFLLTIDFKMFHFSVTLRLFLQFFSSLRLLFLNISMTRTYFKRYVFVTSKCMEFALLLFHVE